jgi:hypothetical protein
VVGFPGVLRRAKLFNAFGVKTTNAMGVKTVNAFGVPSEWVKISATLK